MNHSGSVTTLGFVADRLVNAIAKAGYTDRVFMSAAGGFALITRMERIYADGRPRPDRFNVDINMSRNGIFTIQDYLDALLKASPGRFRVVVFLVTSEKVTQSDKPLEPKAAMRFFDTGLDILPVELRPVPYAPAKGYHTVALIYEFEHANPKPATQIKPSGIQGRDHLTKAGIWAALN